MGDSICCSDKTVESTTLIITQRLSTIQHAYKVIVLDRGEIQEIGRHDELIALGGTYASMYKMQAKSL